MMKYEILTSEDITEVSCEDFATMDEYQNHLEELTEEGYEILEKFGYEFNDSDVYVVHFLDGNERTALQEMTLCDAVGSLAVKEGYNLVKYENGNVGYIAIYGSNENGFEIIGKGMILTDNCDSYEVHNGVVDCVWWDGDEYNNLTVEKVTTQAVPVTANSRVKIDGVYYYFGS